MTAGIEDESHPPRDRLKSRSQAVPAVPKAVAKSRPSNLSGKGRRGPAKAGVRNTGAGAAQKGTPEPKSFRQPRVGISKVYTRTGDLGETSLVGGQRVSKDDARIEAYGTVDELNSWIGLARAAALDSGAAAGPMASSLLRVQHQLFNLGSILATLPADLGAKQPRVTDADIAWLEKEMDSATATLLPLRSFVLPGGSRLNALLHLARTVCRRAERVTVSLRRNGGCGDLEVRYLNRLSDALFVWSREASRALAQPEVLWDPNHG